MIPIYLDEQLVSGTFEHMLNELIDNQMDLRIFDGKYNNDLTGATAGILNIWKKKTVFNARYGKKLQYRGRVKLARNEGDKYMSKTGDCVECPYADKCFHSRNIKKKQRTLYIPVSKYIEPVFANITYCKGITRFTLRGDKKVNIQWKLYCIVHNISKCNTAKNRKMAWWWEW